MNLFDETDLIDAEEICKIVERKRPAVNRYISKYKIFVSHVSDRANTRRRLFYRSCIQVLTNLMFKLADDGYTHEQIGKALRATCGQKDERLIEVLKNSNSMDQVERHFFDAARKASASEKASS